MGSFLLAGISLGIMLLAVLPLILQVDLFYDFQYSKVGCSISLYGIVKIIGGYLAPCQNGIAFHSSRKKAFIFDFRKIGEEQKSFSKRHGFRLRKIFIGIESNIEMLFILNGFIQIGRLLLLFCDNAPMVNYCSYFTENENFRLLARFSFSTILAKEVFLTIKNFVSKGVNYIWRKKKLAT